VAQSIRDYLKERLSPPLFERLREGSAGFSRPLFVVDPDTGRFECAAHLGDEELDDTSFVDALCVACELLTESKAVFDPSDPLLEPPASSGTVELTYDFVAEEEEVFRRFKALLKENATAAAGFQTDDQKYPWGHRVRIKLSYASDFDYQSKKDIIDLMLLVARRRAKGAPIFGKRL